MINTNKFETTEHPECSEDTKLFFDDVYKSGTRGKKQQVDVLQYGRSMIEMLGVLAIVGVLSVGGIAGYSKAMMKFKTNKTIDQFSHIIANIRTLYAQQTSYEGLDTSTAVQMGVVPDSLATSNNRPYITNIFGGDVSIFDANSYGTGPNGEEPPSFGTFIVLFTGLPKDACLSLATMDWGSPSSSGFMSIAIEDEQYHSGPIYQYGDSCTNNYGYTTACYGNVDNPTPISVSTAATACSKCETSSCSIGVRFK